MLMGNVVLYADLRVSLASYHRYIDALCHDEQNLQTPFVMLLFINYNTCVGINHVGIYMCAH